MDERFVCRACRRGRCDQCEDGACACPQCGVDVESASRFASGGVISPGRGDAVMAMLAGCDYILPRALSERVRPDGPIPAF